MMNFVVRVLGYKPKEIKPKPREKKKVTDIEKKFKRLLKNGYSINRARYLSKM
jgi:hypothetical protein